MSQYLGWVGIKLSKFNDTIKLLKNDEILTATTTATSRLECQEKEIMYRNKVSAASKLAYHSLSKLFEVNRILKTIQSPPTYDLLHNELIDLITEIKKLQLFKVDDNTPIVDNPGGNKEITMKTTSNFTSSSSPLLLLELMKTLYSYQYKSILKSDEMMVTLGTNNDVNGNNNTNTTTTNNNSNDNNQFNNNCGAPTVVFEGIEKYLILFIRNIKNLLSLSMCSTENENTITASTTTMTTKTAAGEDEISSNTVRDDAFTQRLCHIVSVFELLSSFITSNLNRLSEINHSDKKHRVSKKSRKLANKAKREKQDNNRNNNNNDYKDGAVIGEKESSTSLKIKEVSSEKDENTIEEEEEAIEAVKEAVNSDNNRGSVDVVVKDGGSSMKECVDWTVIADWLLDVRIRQLKQEVVVHFN